MLLISSSWPESWDGNGGVNPVSTAARRGVTAAWTTRAPSAGRARRERVPLPHGVDRFANHSWEIGTVTTSEGVSLLGFLGAVGVLTLSLIHISEPTRR